MQFNTHILTDPLDKCIESIFHFKGFQPDHSIERVVPTGHIFILFELDGIPRKTFDNRTLEPKDTFSKVWISGMHKNYLSISAHQNSEMFVIQFKSHGAYPFLQFPLSDVADKVVPAQELLGAEILTLHQEILNAPNSEEKFILAQKWLENRFDAHKFPDIELLTSIHKIMEEPLSNHRSIVSSYPKTQKHFIQQFKKYAGLTPKVFHRIIRFNEILQQIHQKKSIAWSQIAYQFGYTDQSHFIKEFKEFSGFSPEEFIEADHHKDEPNFFPLDREG